MQQITFVRLSMPAWLMTKENQLEKCHLSGMDFSQLLVEMDDSSLIPMGTELTLVFYIKIDGVNRRCQEMVKVDRVSGHTAELRFQCFDNVHSCNIEKLIHLSQHRNI